MDIVNFQGRRLRYFQRTFLMFVCGAFFATGTMLSAGEPAQSFSVSVPVESSVQPPPDLAIIHDLTDNEQQFPPQQWTVSSNSLTGMVVDFTVASGFVHNIDPTSKSNAILSVGVSSSNGPASWVASKPADRTNVTDGDESASVRVESDNVGSAKINLNVGFDDSDQFEALPGLYETTVVATLTMP